MSNSEWSLLFFTLIAQTSVGAFLVWQLPLIFGLKQVLLKSKLAAKPYLIITLLAGIALLISFLHLGKPSHAFYSLSNLKASWLSREILFAALFSGFTFLITILIWKKFQNKIILATLSVLTILSGLALVFSMAKLYMLPTVPSWNSPTTMIEFFTATILLGLLAAIFMGKQETPAEAGLCLLIVLPLVLLVKLVNLLFISVSLSASGDSFLILLLSCRALFLLAGIVLIFYWLLKKKPLEQLFTGNLFYAVSMLFLLSEITGRYLFYASFTGIGV